MRSDLEGRMGLRSDFDSLCSIRCRSSLYFSGVVFCDLKIRPPMGGKGHSKAKRSELVQNEFKRKSHAEIQHHLQYWFSFLD